MPDWTSLAAFSGFSSGNVFHAHHNHIRINFRTDSSVVGRGFNGSYHITGICNICSCQGFHTLFPSIYAVKSELIKSKYEYL